MTGESNTNTPADQGASQQLDQFKYEVANEMGLQLGGEPYKSRKWLCWWSNDQTNDSICRRTP